MAGTRSRGTARKLSPYELGIRTPMFVRWPGKVNPLRDDETLASIIDFVPTILTARGAKFRPISPASTCSTARP